MNNSDEIDLVDLFRTVRKRKRFIMIFIGAVTLASVLYSLLAPEYYKSEAVLMPVGNVGGLSSALGTAGGGLAALLGVGAGTQTPSQQIMALLKTRVLAESVIKANDLIPVIFNDDMSRIRARFDGNDALIMERAVKMMDDYVTFEENKDVATIKISSEFRSPKLAAAVAESYVNGLQDLLNRNSITVAKRNRIFIEGQLEENKRELLAAGKALNEFYKNEKISNVESKLDVSLAHNITGGIDRIGDESIADLQRQKEELDKKIGEAKVLKDVPQQVYLQYLNLKRTLLTQLHSMLAQQYEMARIQESKEDISFQLIDPPEVSEIRSKPKRRLIVTVSFMASALLAVFIVFLMEYIEKFRAELRSRS